MEFFQSARPQSSLLSSSREANLFPTPICLPCLCLGAGSLSWQCNQTGAWSMGAEVTFEDQVHFSHWDRLRLLCLSCRLLFLSHMTLYQPAIRLPESFILPLFPETAFKTNSKASTRRLGWCKVSSSSFPCCLCFNTSSAGLYTQAAFLEMLLFISFLIPQTEKWFFSGQRGGGFFGGFITGCCSPGSCSSAVGTATLLPGQPRCPLQWAGSPASHPSAMIPACDSQEHLINFALRLCSQHKLVTKKDNAWGSRRRSQERTQSSQRQIIAVTSTVPNKQKSWVLLKVGSPLGGEMGRGHLCNELLACSFMHCPARVSLGSGFYRCSGSLMLFY